MAWWQPSGRPGDTGEGVLDEPPTQRASQGTVDRGWKYVSCLALRVPSGCGATCWSLWRIPSHRCSKHGYHSESQPSEANKNKTFKFTSLSPNSVNLYTNIHIYIFIYEFVFIKTKAEYQVNDSNAPNLLLFTKTDLLTIRRALQMVLQTPPGRKLRLAWSARITVFLVDCSNMTPETGGMLEHRRILYTYKVLHEGHLKQLKRTTH